MKIHKVLLMKIHRWYLRFFRNSRPPKSDCSVFSLSRIAFHPLFPIVCLCGPGSFQYIFCFNENKENKYVTAVTDELQPPGRPFEQLTIDPLLMQ